MTPTSTHLERPAAALVPDRYDVLSTLGQGAMGVVYRARDRELDRVVAIKTLQRHEGEAAARLTREAMAAARLSHPGIVTVYDVGRHVGTPYVVMECFGGRTLTELLERGPLAAERAVQVGVQVCRALAYAHAQGVVHRDVKSSNIMVDAAWHVKLTDFGVARIADRPANDAGMLIGTPAYMAPEQIRGGAGDPRSDLYAVGVVLYEALTGERPFPGDDVARVLDDVVHVDPVPPRERNFAVSPALDAVVRRAMSKEAGDRYPDAASLAEALSQAGAVGTTLPRLPAGPGGALVTAAIALVLGGVLYLGARAPEPLTVQRDPGAVTTAEALRDAQVAAALRDVPPPATPLPAPRTVAAAPASAAPAGKPGCLSVNAVPFAAVYVDDREVGDTPQACVRLRPGRHRVYFVWSSQRSPEHVVEMMAERAEDNPLRLSYDFRRGRFLTHAD
jgi:hypothetical protein